MDSTDSLSRRVNHLIITGGSGGLGKAIVGAFVASDWEVKAPGRDELDVSNFQAIKDYLEWQSVDLLICAAGIICDAPLARMSENAWDQILAVNYQAAAIAAAAVVPRMIQQGKGHIVFISSYSALHPPFGQLAYATAKAALLGLTQTLALKNGQYGIRVNAVLPGFLETRMTEVVSEKRKISILADHSLGRFNTPTAVAKFIHYLHQDLCHTSGQIFQLDSRIS